MTLPNIDYARIRDVSRFLGEPSKAPISLRQAVVASIEMGAVSVLMSDNQFPVGPVNFLDSYNPIVGETVWMLKQGADILILGRIVIPGGSVQDPLHYVGETEYGEPGFVNNWQNFGGDYEPANFYKDPDGFVHLGGVVKNTSATAYNTTIFTLPEGYRPDYDHSTPICAAAGTLTAKLWPVNVEEDGEVKPATATNPGVGTENVKNAISLDGIRFMAAEDTEYERIHEWVPLGRAGNWTWDYSIQSKIPPGQWHRWDGLVRCRGRLNNSTTPSETRVALLSERSSRQRWNKLLPTLMIESATSEFEAVRVDAQPTTRELVRITSAFNNELLLDGFQWFADIPESYWRPLPLVNSWVRYTSQPHWGPPAFFKDGYGVVHVRGLIRSGSTTLDSIIGTLPVDCRPLARKIIPSWHGGNAATSLHVDVSGNIRVGSTGISNNHLTLDMINFRANPEYTF